MRQSNIMNPIARYFNAHKTAITTCIKRLKLNPITNSMTTIVITIALLLPTLCYLVFSNLDHIAQSSDQGAQINLFLRNNVNQRAIDTLLSNLKNNKDITTVTYISAEQGLKEFTQTTNTKEVLHNLDENPIPAMIVITPKLSIHATHHMVALRTQLASLPEVSVAKLDNIWIERLNNLLILAKKFLIGLSVILGIGVVFIVSSSVQSASQKYHKEVNLYNLIGATRSYIRRPFLYTGLFLALIASLFNIISITLFAHWLNPQLLRLATLYQTPVQLHGLNAPTALIMTLTALILGYIGAFVAISCKIRKN